MSTLLPVSQEIYSKIWDYYNHFDPKDPNEARLISELPRETIQVIVFRSSRDLSRIPKFDYFSK